MSNRDRYPTITEVSPNEVEEGMRRARKLRAQAFNSGINWILAKLGAPNPKTKPELRSSSASVAGRST